MVPPPGWLACRLTGNSVVPDWAPVPVEDGLTIPERITMKAAVPVPIKKYRVSLFLGGIGLRQIGGGVGFTGSGGRPR